MNTPTWRAIVDALDLVPHPEEGGYFHETYRSRERFEPGGPFAGPRSVGTAIYYLLTPDSYSALHRLPGDEIFHFYLGDPVEMLLLRAPCWSPTRSSGSGFGRCCRSVPSVGADRRLLLSPARTPK